MVSVNTVAPAATEVTEELDDATGNTTGEAVEEPVSDEAAAGVEAIANTAGEVETVCGSSAASAREREELDVAESEVTKSSVLCSKVAARIRPFASSLANDRCE
jgi:hypothetical protein